MTQINLVLNPDKLSHAESIRILKTLKDIHISLYRTINNKMPIDSSCADLDDAFSNISMLNFPYSETPLIGIDSLQRFLKMNDAQLERQLDVC